MILEFIHLLCYLCSSVWSGRRNCYDYRVRFWSRPNSCKMRETQSSTYELGLSTPSYPSRIVAPSLPSCLRCPRPPSHHPYNLTSVHLVPAINTLVSMQYSSILFACPNLSLLSDQLYLPVPFLFQLFLNTCCGFEALKPAPWPSLGLHRLGKFLDPQDKMAGRGCCCFLLR